MATPGEESKPQGRVGAALGPNDRNPLADHTQASTSYRRRRDRAMIKIATLDEEVREPCVHTKVSDLPPETPSLEAQMKVGHRRALDQDTISEVIVSGRKPHEGHVYPSRAERSRHTARRLEDVRDDSAGCRVRRMQVPSA